MDHDLVVIGAGIHGAGVAQAAALAGRRVLVLEQAAPAAGTSSRSSKLIHGGLRYLESGQFRLVRESLQERETLLRIAPTLVRRLPFHIPVYRGTRRRQAWVAAGLALYTLLAGGRAHSRFRRLPRGEFGDLDGLAGQNLQSVFQYHDAQTDDVALTNAVLESAKRFGATVRFPARFDGATRTEIGYVVRYRDERRDHVTHVRALVNAAGPWVNSVLASIGFAHAPEPIELVQGTHLVLEGEMRRGAYYLEAPADARAVFALPWQDAILVGTTESPYHGDPAAVRPPPADIDYLLATFQHYFPERPAKIRESFAGLRVLPAGEHRAFHRPRETVLRTDHETLPRLVSIYGGKLTAYRLTAQRVLALLAPMLDLETPLPDTATISLS
jgi:glycerol-3-phosphate dehydrogenase